MTDMETVKAHYPDADIGNVSAISVLWQVFRLTRETSVPWRMVPLSKGQPTQALAWANARQRIEAEGSIK